MISPSTSIWLNTSGSKDTGVKLSDEIIFRNIIGSVPNKPSRDSFSFLQGCDSMRESLQCLISHAKLWTLGSSLLHSPHNFYTSNVVLLANPAAIVDCASALSSESELELKSISDRFNLGFASNEGTASY